MFWFATYRIALTTKLIRLIFVGEQSLQNALSKYIIHYYYEYITCSAIQWIYPKYPF